MSALLWIAAYLGLVLFSMAILVRLRPDWVLRREPIVDAERFPHFTEAEHKAWNAHTEAMRGRAFPDREGWERVRRAVDGRVNFGNPYIGLDEMWASPLPALAPFVVALVLPVSMVVRASTRALNDKTATLAELEKELVAARKEVDDLLGRSK